MRYLIWLVLALYSYSISAEELELFSPQLLCKRMDGENSYEYYGGFYIRNMSKKEITVISDTKKPFLVISKDKPVQIYFATENVISINDIPLIPSIIEFKLVILRPGEATYIGDKFQTKHFFKEADLHYRISDNYDGRFGFWSGYVSISNVAVSSNSDCH